MSSDNGFLAEESDVFGNMTMFDVMNILKQLSPVELQELQSLLDLDEEDGIDTLLRYPQGGETYHLKLMKFLPYRVHKALLLYIPPILIILGTFGNISSFIILRRKAMLKFSTYFYLMVLAIADTFVLYVGLLPLWIGELSHFQIDVQANWVCKTSSAVGYTVSDFSVWLIIAVTVERYIVVCHPLKANRLCNTRAARNVVLVLFITMCLVNIHFFWTVEIRNFFHEGEEVSRCSSTENHEVLVDVVWPWVDAFIYSFAPFVIIMTLNGLIIHQVMLAKRLRVEMRGGDYEQRRPSHEGSTRLTVMLLTISFAFLLTTLPMNIVSIAAAFVDKYKNDLSRVSQFQLARTVTELLMYTNHSMNFFLYCATGQKFRHQLVWMICYAKRTYNITWGSEGSNGRAEPSKTAFPSSISKSLLSRNDKIHKHALSCKSGRNIFNGDMTSKLRSLLPLNKKRPQLPRKQSTLSMTMV